MRTINTFVLTFMLIFTAGLFAQRPLTAQEQSAKEEMAKQQILNSFRFDALEKATIENQQNLQKLAVELASLRSSLDRFTGMGMGIGITLTALQGILVILTYRKSKL